MSLEAKRRTRRRRTTAARPRRRSVRRHLSAPVARRRRRRSGMSESGLSARGGYTALALQFFEAGAGAVVAKAIGNFMPIKNAYIKALAGAGISVLTATQLKRPILGTGMAAVFAADLFKNLNVPGLSEMEQGEFIDEMSQPQMIYLTPQGEPVFMNDDGNMLYADGSDSGLSYTDYE